MYHSRSSLYPRLEDHNLVKQYLDVRGFARNVFFLSHQHRENDGNEENSGSKYNTYEVRKLVFVGYLINIQGTGANDQGHGIVFIKVRKGSLILILG
jgi:hypothetical protein